MKIADGIYSLSQNKAGEIHAYLLDGGDGLTLIDGLYDSDAAPIFQEIELMGKKPSDLKHIIATHAHRSHIGGMAALKKASNAKVYCHEWEVDIMEGKKKAKSCGFWPKRPYEVYYIQAALAMGVDGHVPVQIDQTLKDGDHVGPLTILSTPGHTPGCLSFSWPEKKALIVGDVVSTYPSLEPSWAGLTLDWDQNLRSIGKLTDFSDVEIVGVGHGNAITEDAHFMLKYLRDHKR